MQPVLVFRYVGQAGVDAGEEDAAGNDGGGSSLGVGNDGCDLVSVFDYCGGNDKVIDLLRLGCADDESARYDAGAIAVHGVGSDLGAADESAFSRR